MVLTDVGRSKSGGCTGRPLPLRLRTDSTSVRGAIVSLGWPVYIHYLFLLNYLVAAGDRPLGGASPHDGGALDVGG
jgi:hypothetical protein